MLLPDPTYGSLRVVSSSGSSDMGSGDVSHMKLSVLGYIQFIRPPRRRRPAGRFAEARSHQFAGRLSPGLPLLGRFCVRVGQRLQQVVADIAGGVSLTNWGPCQILDPPDEAGRSLLEDAAPEA